MQWLSDYKQDIGRYTAYGNRGGLIELLMQQGLWALLQYRVSRAVYESNMASQIRRPLLVLMVAWQKVIETSTGISLPYSASIGPGLYIGHFGNIIINDRAKIGSNCNISQGVSIGVSGRGARRGVPAIGNRVYIGANATVAGKVTIGNDVVIAANSLVISSFDGNCTVMGVPAVRVSDNDSHAYIDPESLS